MNIEEIQGKTIQLAHDGSKLELAGESGGETKLPVVRLLAYTGGKIRQKFAGLPLVVDLAGMRIPTQEVPLRYAHQGTVNGIGHTTRIAIEGSNLIADGVVSRDTDAAREFVVSAKNGFPWQASIGADIEKVVEIKPGVKAEINGREFTGPLFHVVESRLKEISPLDLGADANTETRVAASHDQQTEGGQSMGKEATQGSSSSEIQASNTEANNEGVNGGGSVRASALDDLRADAEKAGIEATRQNKIKASAKAVMDSRPELASTVLATAERAIEAGTDAGAFELEMSRLHRDIPGAGRPRGERGMNSEQIEAAICMGGGMTSEELEAEFSEEVLNAADKQFGNGIGLHEALILAARSNGWSGVSVRSDMEGVLRAAFPDGGVQASFSTINLPNVFANVMNKQLKRGFMSVDDSAMKITDHASVRDFKPTLNIAFGGDYQFKDLPASGEIEHAKPSEVAYTNKAETGARMIGITREQIINDDTGALTRVPRLLGRGSRLYLNEKFWGAFLDDANIFKADNSNLKTGAASALGIDSLTAAHTAFMRQTDPQGKPLGVKPSILLVPTELKATADQLVSSLEIRDTTADTRFGVANPHRGKYRVVDSPYLTNATAWYLLADPADLPIIEIAWLNGRRIPFVESARADFNKLGIQTRGYFDFGVAMQEYRAGVKSEGTD